MNFIFDLLYFVLLIFYIPILAMKGKLHHGYKMRIGLISEPLREKLSGKMNIWIHAVSVGEVLAVADLVEKIKERFPKKQIVCSVVTKSGYQIASERLGEHAVVIFAPLDFSFVVRKFIKIISPEIYILTETEIWPNLFGLLHRQQVPIIQVNGRISDKSYCGYKKLGFITKKVLRWVDCFCMQSPTDAERIIQLGAKPDVVKIIGNLKFDNVPVDDHLNGNATVLNPESQWVIAGSTHPGEEELILNSFLRLKMKDPGARLAICPRHVERVNDVHAVIRSMQLRSLNLSAVAKNFGDVESIIVVDTIGKLRSLYRAAKVVIIGKTFKVGGGQNMIEPAFFGKPTIVGPLTYNFKDIVDLLIREKALVQVSTPEGLTDELTDLWENPVRCESLGMAARRVVEKYKGATDKTIREIEQLLKR
ncbi:MAG: 3-deoxy-D-manno-octulosonic acid transferase [Candidatus Omnitrophica bacterium]|nr:3-deoxy-D-manno-octulosonic acid transferase [Candidatus Omnitrophota bacterium]